MQQWTATAAVFLLASGSAGAHHSMAARYEERNTITLSGTVTKFDWANPHVWVFLEANGVLWEVEFASRMELKRAGWRQDTLKVGDLVSINASPARDRSRKAHGKTLFVGSRRFTEPGAVAIPVAKSGKAAPRWPDGHPRLGPEPGQFGYWANPSLPALYESSAGNIRMSAEGVLANLADAGKIAPFQPWARALYLYRQRNFLKDDPMASCLPPGGPRQFHAPYGVQFLEEPARQRMFVLSRGGNRNWRLIPLDGRALPAMEDLTGTFFGYSSGRWEGDVLVVDSHGYAERFWFSNGGLPHTESLRLRERISRPDFDTLRYEVTVDDPGAYTRPWTGSWTLEWIAADEADEYFCDDYNRELEHVK